MRKKKNLKRTKARNKITSCLISGPFAGADGLFYFRPGPVFTRGAQVSCNPRYSFLPFGVIIFIDRFLLKDVGSKGK